MVTQLLFGDSFTILEENEKWTRIKMAFDGYECWIDRKQYSRINESEYKKLQQDHHLSSDTIGVASIISTGSVMTLVPGSILPSLSDGKFTLANSDYSFDGSSVKPSKPGRNTIVETALMYLNAPYLWGGRTPFGIDCSGFTQIVYKLSGIDILRDANEQATQGKALSFVEEAQAGDLAFFDNEEGKIIHVGVMLSDKQIIHASGKVRIDLIDHNGIFNTETKKYSHNLRLLKSYL